MVSFTADNREVERSLERIVALSESDGAEFSCGLGLKCVGGNLSIEAPPGGLGKVLMRIPWDCLVPLQMFRLAVEGDSIVMKSHDQGLTGSCVAMMEAILDLYNLTNKFAEHRRGSPWGLIASHPQLLPYVEQRRSGMDAHFRKLLCSNDQNGLLLFTFLNTRIYNYKIEIRQTLAFMVLMPVLDLMNHHIYGATFSEDQDLENRAVTIRRSVPVAGADNECFACYGPYDAFDTWITYGFVDGQAPFVRSVAMTIDLPGLGRIRLTNLVKTRSRNDLPEFVNDLWFYIPQRLAKRGNDIEIASLLIPGPQAPTALRRTLRFLIAEINPVHPQQSDLVLQAEEQIIAANRTYYESFLLSLRSLSSIEPVQRAILDNFIRMCELQLARIQVYVHCAEG